MVTLCAHHHGVMRTRANALRASVDHGDEARKALDLLALHLARACPQCPDPRK